MLPYAILRDELRQEIDGDTKDNSSSARVLVHLNALFSALGISTRDLPEFIDPTVAVALCLCLCIHRCSRVDRLPIGKDCVYLAFVAMLIRGITVLVQFSCVIGIFLDYLVIAYNPMLG